MGRASEGGAGRTEGSAGWVPQRCCWQQVCRRTPQMDARDVKGQSRHTLQRGSAEINLLVVLPHVGFISSATAVQAHAAVWGGAAAGMSRGAGTLLAARRRLCRLHGQGRLQHRPARIAQQLRCVHCDAAPSCSCCRRLAGTGCSRRAATAPPQRRPCAASGGCGCKQRAVGALRLPWVAQACQTAAVLGGPLERGRGQRSLPAMLAALITGANEPVRAGGGQRPLARRTLQ